MTDIVLHLKNQIARRRSGIAVDSTWSLELEQVAVAEIESLQARIGKLTAQLAASRDCLTDCAKALHELECYDLEFYNKLPLCYRHYQCAKTMTEERLKQIADDTNLSSVLRGCSHRPDTIAELITEVRRLQTELAALREDKERLEWLEDYLNGKFPALELAIADEPVNKPSFRAAIDAARKRV